jgi:Transposase DDE domain
LNVIGEVQAGVMLFERDDRLVTSAFQRGEFDYLEGVSEVCETDFFRTITEKKVLEKLAATYPTPNKKHDVPLWVYIASDISMRFHGVHSFNAFPYVVHSGGMVNAFGPAMGHKAVHPETKDVTLSCSGFNDKNDYDRQTPCDPDHLRKTAKRTDETRLMAWFNKDVVGIYKQHHVFDAEGIFIGDATYLFVPDNENYEGSSLMLFDEHNHPVNSKNLSKQEMAHCTWRRCYKLVNLIHTNRAGDFFLYAGLQVVPGKDHESPILYEMVDNFVKFHGKGIMKKLILDRGFLDGVEIGRCKKDRGIDVLMPVRRDMDIYADVVGLAKGGELDFKPWEQPVPALKPVPVHRPEHIRKREETRQRTLAKRRTENPAPARPAEKTLLRSETAVVHSLKTFSACPVPLDAVVNKEVYADGHEDYWVLLSTARVDDPVLGRQEYALRTTIEERHRQLKCFSDLEAFTSRDFSLIVNQVVFVLLTYSLLQWYLLRTGREELNAKTPTRTLDLLRPTTTAILIFYQSYVAYLSPLEHQELVLTLNEKARKKILAKTRKLRRSLADQLTKPRSP